MEAGESLTATERLPDSPSAHSHRGTQLMGNCAWKEVGVNGAVLDCSSLPGAAESCPHPGLCDLKARS